MQLETVDVPLPHGDLSERVFQGKFLEMRQLQPIQQFCRLARKLIRTALSSSEPVLAHQYLSKDEYFDRLNKLETRFRSSRELHQAFGSALQLIGFDLADTFADRLILRVIPPLSIHQGFAHSHVEKHRDTWGANIYQQINWWAPIYPIARNRTIGFYPENWLKPLANTTGTWRFKEYLAARKEQPPEYVPDYPSTPQLLVQPQGQPFRPVIKPGDLLCFSAAHLHGSIPNSSRFTRFSFETRTVSMSDIKSGRAAPNIDNQAKEQMLNLFSNLVSGEKLESALSTRETLI